MTPPAKPKAGRRGQGGGRPRAPAAKVLEAIRLVREENYTPEDAAEQVGVGSMTVRRVLADPSRLGPVTLAAAPAPAPPPVPAAVEPPPTPNDKRVDELVSQSRTWRRVCEAFARWAARNPGPAAADLAAELRGLNL